MNLASIDLAWQYLRKSQAEFDDPHVLDRHRSLLARVAQQDDRSILPEHCFEEIGSGELIETRPAFLRLLRLWEALPRDRGGLVYVVELSRLTRGLLSDQGRVMDALMRAHILIRTPHRIYDLRVWDDRFQFMAHGLVSNAELELTKERFARAKREMLLRGQVRGGQVPEFGYRWSKDAGCPLTTEAFPALVRCCEEVHHLSIARLAARYGVPGTTLHQTLTNPFICGYPVKHTMPTGRRRAGGKKPGQQIYRRAPRHLWEWPEHQNMSYPHACTREEWESIWQVLAERRRKRAKTGALDGFCRDVIRFEGVEKAPRLGCVSGWSEKGLTYQVKVEERPLLFIRREPVHEAAENAVRNALRDPEGLRNAWQALQDLQAKNAAESARSASVEELLSQRDRAQQQAVDLLQRELDASPAAAVTIALLREKKEAQTQRLTSEIQAARQRVELPSVQITAATLARFIELGQDWETEWPALPEEEKRAIVNDFLQVIPVRVEVGPRPPWLKRTVLPVQYQPWVGLVSE